MVTVTGSSPKETSSASTREPYPGTVSRQPRVAVPGATYHLTARGNDGNAIFTDDFDRVHLLDLLSRATIRYGWVCLAYCLMGNHYHLLVQLTKPELSSGMRFIQTRYARRFNARNDATGHVFGDRFHDRRVEGDTHLLAAAVYTVLNPVRAGIVNRPDKWPWSSYRATAGLTVAPGFLDPVLLLDLLSPDLLRARALYRDLVEQYRSEAAATVTRVGALDMPR